MRTLLITLALVMGVSVAAQDGARGKTPQEKAAHRTERMVRELGLDAAQQEKIASVNLDYATGMEQVESLKNEANRPGRKKELKAMRDRAYGSILSAEQYARWMDLRKTDKDKKSADKPGKED